MVNKSLRYLCSESIARQSGPVASQTSFGGNQDEQERLVFKNCDPRPMFSPDREKNEPVRAAGTSPLTMSTAALDRSITIK
ncbi:MULTISPECIES: hypothetical protein [unclassified Mesorhizobium]|uniref:hypothetical protein n=1 Tax=unclassified Mesorhizobium TaxID=325217 RepID=UPI00041F4CC0|nr:hypothetical protein [Mesorhizobium sp. LSHC420B00]